MFLNLAITYVGSLEGCNRWQHLIHTLNHLSSIQFKTLKLIHPYSCMGWQNTFTHKELFNSTLLTAACQSQCYFTNDVKTDTRIYNWKLHLVSKDVVHVIANKRLFKPMKLTYNISHYIILMSSIRLSQIFTH